VPMRRDGLPGGWFMSALNFAWPSSKNDNDVAMARRCHHCHHHGPGQVEGQGKTQYWKWQKGRSAQEEPPVPDAAHRRACSWDGRVRKESRPVRSGRIEPAPPGRRGTLPKVIIPLLTGCGRKVISAGEMKNWDVSQLNAVPGIGAMVTGDCARAHATRECRAPSCSEIPSEKPARTG
jgi:hypothetical protein